MNNPSAITITLKGPRGLAELTEFANSVNVLRQCLMNVCRCVAGTDEVEFDVSDLRIDSATLSATPVPNGVSTVLLNEVPIVVHGTVSALEGGGDLDPRLDFSTVRAFSAFSSIIKKPETWLEVGGTRLTKTYVERVRRLIEPDVSSMGSVTGRLEAFSIHNQNRFTLYPPVAREGVECVFERSALDEVLKAVDRSVTVYGAMHYAKGRAFPTRVDVESFEVLPDVDTLPTLLNACGILHNETQSVDMVRELRDEW